MKKKTVISYISLVGIIGLLFVVSALSSIGIDFFENKTVTIASAIVFRLLLGFGLAGISIWLIIWEGPEIPNARRGIKEVFIKSLGICSLVSVAAFIFSLFL